MSEAPEFNEGEEWKYETQEPPPAVGLEEADKIITKFIKDVSEHVDAVQVFVSLKNDHSHNDGDGTSFIQNGHGNFYARFGQIVRWVNANK